MRAIASPRIGAIEPLVGVVEQRDFAHAQRLGRGRSSASRIVASASDPGCSCVTGAMPTETACVAARGGHQEHVDALRGVLRERAAHAERLVVGVGQHGHQAASRPGAHRVPPLIS